MNRKFCKWLNNAVFYEIYPQSFNDTNSDGIGDLQGIIEKLDYIKGLGCNAIWVNPCFVSPFMDAGYDVSDYYNIAPRYGTNEDMKELCCEVHKRGMHIILDLVPGHTSMEHPWFKESAKPERNEYTDRYVWTDTVWDPPIELSTLRGFSDRDGAAVVNFFSFQPALNYGYQNVTAPWQLPTDAKGPKATFKAMMDVMTFWLDIGCDGFRVDMASSLVKNDPDAVGITKLWNNARKILDEKYPDSVLISEWGDPATSLNAGFDMDFLLHFGPSHYMDLFREDNPYFSKNAGVDVADFITAYRKLYANSKDKGYICIPSGNHDMLRISDKLDDKALRLAFAFLLTMPGCPFIYYGDEIGMKYIKLNSKEGGYYRTGSRTPMQWDSSKNNGFSDADAEKLYLPVDSSNAAPTVEAQINDDSSLYNEVKKLLEIRNSNSQLQSDAKIEFLMDSGYPLAYTRENVDGKVLIMINPSEKAVEFHTEITGKQLYCFGTAGRIEGGYALSGQSAVIIKVNK